MELTLKDCGDWSQTDQESVRPLYCCYIGIGQGENCMLELSVNDNWIKVLATFHYSIENIILSHNQYHVIHYNGGW